MTDNVDLRGDEADQSSSVLSITALLASQGLKNKGVDVPSELIQRGGKDMLDVINAMLSSERTATAVPQSNIRDLVISGIAAGLVVATFVTLMWQIYLLKIADSSGLEESRAVAVEVSEVRENLDSIRATYDQLLDDRERRLDSLEESRAANAHLNELLIGEVLDKIELLGKATRADKLDAWDDPPADLQLVRIRGRQNADNGR